MKRYIEAEFNLLETVFRPKAYLKNAYLVSGAKYHIEQAHPGLIQHSYIVSLEGTNKEISCFIAYLRENEIEVEEF